MYLCDYKILFSIEKSRGYLARDKYLAFSCLLEDQIYVFAIKLGKEIVQ